MKYYIGWDVGAWQCRRSSSSCDALFFLNEDGYRGHCRESLSGTVQAVLECEGDDHAHSLVDSWRELCNVDAVLTAEDEFVIAIDTPLGWPKDFVALITGGGISSRWKLPARRKDIENTFLYRKTERDLGSSLSAITQQIGSQSTKGMALLSALGALRQSWGVWMVDSRLTLIETYPASCLRSAVFVNWVENLASDTPPQDDTIHDDEFDAFICAYVAKAFDQQPAMLKQPPASDPDQEIDEGWIFYPDGNLISPTLLHGKSGLVESEESFQDALASVKEQVIANLKEPKASTLDDWIANKISQK